VVIGVTNHATGGRPADMSVDYRFCARISQAPDLKVIPKNDTEPNPGQHSGTLFPESSASIKVAA
jgi:hypothetical protein